MKIKKYFSIIVIIFLFVNIIFVNGEATIEQENNADEESATEIIPENIPSAETEISNSPIEENLEIENSEDINEEENIQEDAILTNEENSNSEEINNENIIEENQETEFPEENNSNETAETEINNSEEIKKTNNEIHDNQTTSDNIKQNETENKKIELENTTIEDTNNFENNKTNESIENEEENETIPIENLSENVKNSYINIDSISSYSGNSKLQTQKNDSKNCENKTIKLPSNVGEKDIIGEIPADFDENKIIKTEEKIDSETKKITIESEKHLDAPLTVYSDLPKETKKENIKVYWEDETNKSINKEIDIKEYIDEDSNGLIERISWIVPHLSKQVFEIRIEVEKNNGNSDEIILSVKGPEEEVINPIKFKFNINYTNIQGLNCKLKINNSENEQTQEFFPSQNSSFNIDLQNGTYTWEAQCFEESNSSNIKNGSFKIQEDELIIYDLQEIHLTNENIDFLLTERYDLINITLFYQDKTNQTYQNLSTANKRIPFSEIQNPGKYILEVNATGNEKPTQTATKEFFVAKAEILIQNEEIEVGENAEINVKINSPNKKINSTILSFGDSTLGTYIDYENKYFVNETIPHTYSQENFYNITLKINFENGQELSISKQITVSSQNNSLDNEDPIITLIEPANNAKFIDQTIKFKYNATDNIKISNCSYSLGYYPCPSCYGSEEYFNRTNVSKKDYEWEMSFNEFDTGNYTWEVECFDNSGNRGYEKRTFEIVPSGFEALTYKEESIVENTKSKLDDFLTKVNSENPEVKTALEDLEIYSDLELYQKRIQVIKRYFQTNYKTEKATKENLEELDEINKKIPIDIELIKTSEYVKNSISNNLKEKISEIISLQIPLIKKSKLKKLTEDIFSIQNKFTASTVSKKIKIEYENEIQEITLITKEIKTNEKDKTFFEYIPEKLGDVVFLTSAKEYENGFFKIKQEDLEGEKIIYYINDFIDLEDAKKTETILFEDFSNENLNGITGFSILDLNATDPLSYFIIIIFLTILSVFGIKTINQKKKWQKLKGDEKISKTYLFIEEAKKALMQNKIESAKYSYYKIKELYPELINTAKIKMQKDLKKIKIGIDKREISNLVKEYEKQKNNRKINEAKLIYKKIQNTYKALPKKYQEKVYKRICPKTNNLF